MKLTRSILFAASIFCLPIAVCVAADKKADAVLINKSEKSLYLLSDDKIFARYHVVFGGKPKGHKVQKGDQRTPEGKYVLDYKNQNSNYFKSIHISYPNAQDIATARKLGVDPGGHIMIHGQPNDLGFLRKFSQLINWTDGCIALTDKDMQAVWDAVDAGTPINIVP